MNTLHLHSPGIRSAHVTAARWLLAHRCCTRPIASPGSPRRDAIAGAPRRRACAPRPRRAPLPAASAAAPAAPAATSAPAAGAATGARRCAAEGANGTRALDEQIQDLKKDVVDLNSDLFVLEEELLFPANTQVAVFVSMDVGDFFALDSITLKIDNREVSNYLYTPREVAALLKGGVQRLYVGNLKVRQARAGGVLQRQGSERARLPARRQRSSSRRAWAPSISSSRSPTERAQQPEFQIKDWE